MARKKLQGSFKWYIKYFIYFINYNIIFSIILICIFVHSSSIGVLIFEQTIDNPIINGLSVYRVNYDQLNNEEKNKILASTNLNITCPQIMRLTSITLALVKMLRSDTLIELILNVIRKNVLKKQMNTDHTIVCKQFYLLHSYLYCS